MEKTTLELPITAPDHRDNWTPPAPVAVAKGCKDAPRRRYAKTSSPLTRPLDAVALPNDGRKDAAVERWFGVGMTLMLVVVLVLVVLKSDWVACAGGIE